MSCEDDRIGVQNDENNNVNVKNNNGWFYDTPSPTFFGVIKYLLINIVKFLPFIPSLTKDRGL